MSTAQDDPFELVGTRLDDKYEIGAVVAEGGFGVVYQAEHCALQKVVALKVLKVPQTLTGAARSEFLDKFALEARTIAKFEHPSIVRVIDFGASAMPRGEPAPWMVLEWLDGTSLEAHLAERGVGNGIDPTQALGLLGPVFEAIAYAHDEGVVHRDLKPANLMLVRSRRGELSLRVLDFGIAKLMGQEERTSSGHTATSSSMQAFTLPYAAPEQVTAMRTGPWTDVHALALILVEVLTGLAPITGDDVAELYASALSAQRPTPCTHGLDVGAWEPVLARALAFKPADRFPDARALLEALCSSLPGACWLPLAAAPASLSETFPTAPQPSTMRGTDHTNPTRTSTSAWLLVGVVGGLLVLAIAGGTWVLAIRGTPVAAAHQTSAMAAPAGMVTPSAPREVPQITAPLLGAPDGVRDEGALTIRPTIAPPTEDGRSRPRQTTRGGARRESGSVSPGVARPTSASEHLPVE